MFGFVSMLSSFGFIVVWVAFDAGGGGAGAFPFLLAIMLCRAGGGGAGAKRFFDL